MPLLRPSFINQIQTSLDESCFTAADFQIDYPDKGRVLVRIRFRYAPQYEFTIQEKSSTETVEVSDLHMSLAGIRRERRRVEQILAIERPGKYKVEEVTEIGEMYEAPGRVGEWCSNIKADLVATKKYEDPLADLRTEIGQQFDENIRNPDETFTVDELETVRSQLDSLVDRFRKLEENRDLTKEQLDALEAELSEIKESARYVPRGVWARISSNKIMQILADYVRSKAGRALFLDTIGKTIAGG